MIGSWASEFLLPIGVPNDYELDIDWPVVLPELPGDDEDDDTEEDDEDELLRIAALSLMNVVSQLDWDPFIPLSRS
jgi:hypothetical protein